MAVAIKIPKNNSSIEVDCKPHVEVEDFVYVGPDDVMDLADASSQDTMPCVGIITKKLSDTRALMATYYKIVDLEDIESNHTYCISDTQAGAIQYDQPEGPNTVIQGVAQGISDETLIVNIDPQNAVFN
jgi:hypothetical protein